MGDYPSDDYFPQLRESGEEFPQMPQQRGEGGGESGAEDGQASQDFECPEKPDLESSPDLSCWNPDVDCDGYKAKDWAQWYVDNCDFDLATAQRQVMKEFPALFEP